MYHSNIEVCQLAGERRREKRRRPCPEKGELNDMAKQLVNV